MISNTLTRKFVSIWVAVAILMVYSVVLTAKPIVPTGGVSVIGEVTVDGQKITSGSTFFSDSIIATAADSRAILSLGKLGRIELLPNSSLSLTLADAAINGTMHSGRSRISSPAGVAVNISTKDGAINVDGNEATSFEINTENVSTIVGTDSGLAELTSGSIVNEVTAGENGVAGVYPPQAQFIARLSTTGNRAITVNGASAVGGATIPTGAVIDTPDQVSATIDLGTLGELEIAPNSQLSLEFDHNGNMVKVNLKRGCVKLRTKNNVNGEVETADGVKTKTDSKRRANVCYLAGGSSAASQGGGLSGGAIAAIVAAIGGGTAVLIYVLTKDDEIVSPAK